MESESLVLKMPLTEEEQRDLTRREQYIEENLQTLFSVGKAFADIRDRKLYRETHRTFEDYCKERWQISRPRAYQLIDASVVHEHLSTNVDKNVPLPTNEAQTRALKHVPVEKQPELWTKAAKQNNGNAPTAKQVIQVIETEFEERKPKDYRTVPTHKDMIQVVKAWLSLRFPKFNDALSELQELCVPWMLQEPHSSILLELIKHVEQLYIIDYKRFNVRDACKAALKDWESLDPEELKHLDPKEEIEPEAEQKSESEPELTNTHKNVPAGNYGCCFCGGDYPRDKLFWGDDDVTICRKCASQAQIALLHPDDPEVLAECSQQWNNTGFEPRRTSDLVKIMTSGVFRIFRIDDYAKIIKEFSQVRNSVLEASNGTWKTFEKFETKKAMYERAAELQQDEHIIFEGKAT